MRRSDSDFKAIDKSRCRNLPPIDCSAGKFDKNRQSKNSRLHRMHGSYQQICFLYTYLCVFKDKLEHGYKFKQRRKCPVDRDTSTRYDFHQYYQNYKQSTPRKRSNMAITSSNMFEETNITFYKVLTVHVL